MKKIGLLVLVLALLVPIGCGGSSKERGEAVVRYASLSTIQAAHQTGLETQNNNMGGMYSPRELELIIEPTKIMPYPTAGQDHKILTQILLKNGIDMETASTDISNLVMEAKGDVGSLTSDDVMLTTYVNSNFAWQYIGSYLKSMYPCDRYYLTLLSMCLATRSLEGLSRTAFDDVVDTQKIVDNPKLIFDYTKILKNYCAEKLKDTPYNIFVK